MLYHLSYGTISGPDRTRTYNHSINSRSNPRLRIRSPLSGDPRENKVSQVDSALCGFEAASHISQ